MERIQYVAEEVLYPSGSVYAGDSRKVLERHGIRIIVTQTRQVGHFDLQTLLVNLSASFSLLALSTVVVEVMMLYVVRCMRMCIAWYIVA